MLGTPYYMSPEQVQGAKHADARSDQYSLAVVMYQCASGKLPYDEAELYPLLTKISTGGCEPLHVACPNLPKEFCDVVMRAMAVDRRHRFESVIEFARALLPFASRTSRSYWENNLGQGNPNAAIATRDTVEAPGPPGASPGPRTASRFLDRGGKNCAGSLLVAAVLASIVIFMSMRHGSGSAADSTPIAPTTVAAATAELAPAVPPRSPAQTALAVNEISLTVDPPEATIELDGRRVGTGTFRGSLTADDTQHMLRVSAPGYTEKTVPFVRNLPVDRVSLVQQREEQPALAAKRGANPPRPAPAPPAVPRPAGPETKVVKPTTNNAPIIE
jgi:hypothetical protein